MSQNYKSSHSNIVVMDKIACSVNSLYERYPYPSLPIRNEHDLSGKLHANIMSKILSTAGIDQSFLSGKEILDAGCGTGEKSCYFAYYGAVVTAIDLSCSSLSKGKKLAEKFNLIVDFNRCDIMDFKAQKKFDHIFCLGVLHHTNDPYGRFRKLCDMCKPGGTITIGLYNRYGRFLHRAKRAWIHLNAGEDIERRMSFVESSIYGRKFKNAHEQAYAADKYANPYESYHTINEVIDWFKKNDITCTGLYPNSDIGIFRSFLTQLKWLKNRNGFFIISGRKIER